MAIIAVLAGGVLGGICAAVGHVSLQLGWLSTLVLWWSSGSLITVLLLAAMLSPIVPERAQLADDHA